MDLLDPTVLFTMQGTVAARDVADALDEFGDATYAVTEHTFALWMEQTARAETTVGGDVQSDTWSMYLEPAAAGVVDGSAAITVAGVAYEFDGPPWPATDPESGDVKYVAATVRRTV